MTTLLHKDYSLRTILLDAINEELASNDYSNNAILDNTNYKNWSDMDKFEWAFDRYMIEVGAFENLEYWFSGLAFSSIPFTYYDIEQVGGNTETWFKDLGKELCNITGYSDHPKSYSRKVRV
tara:strand:- start:842 stop:1207 length:366 start_codon:yes stop_codon:yes gene_type:complete